MTNWSSSYALHWHHYLSGLAQVSRGSSCHTYYALHWPYFFVKGLSGECRSSIFYLWCITLTSLLAKTGSGKHRTLIISHWPHYFFRMRIRAALFFAYPLDARNWNWVKTRIGLMPSLPLLLSLSCVCWSRFHRKLSATTMTALFVHLRQSH